VCHCGHCGSHRLSHERFEWLEGLGAERVAKNFAVGLVLCCGHVAHQAAGNEAAIPEGRGSQGVLVNVQEVMTLGAPNDAHHRLHKLVHLERTSVAAMLVQKKPPAEPGLECE